MRAGELSERVSVLELTNAGAEWSWTSGADVWAKAEPSSKTNLFSSVGIGAKTVNFTVRKRLLTLHNAMRWRGQHCFLTDVTETPDRRFLEVTAALVPSSTCSVERTTTNYDERNRPVETLTETVSFPAVLTEKNVSTVATEPMTAVEITYVLVTPTAITLEAGEEVINGGYKYTVTLSHVLDEFKNEYEVVRTGEA